MSANTFVFGNNINTTLASPAASTATSITLSSSANIPSIGADEVLVITLNDAATQSIFEVLYATVAAGAVLTVVRGQEGTTAQNWLAGDFAYASVTKGILNSFTQAAAFAAVVANPGFIQFPVSGGGFLVKQFGKITAVPGDGSALRSQTFATPFTTEVISIVPGICNNYAANNFAFTPQVVEPFSLSVVEVYVVGAPSSADTADVSWEAWGQ